MAKRVKQLSPIFVKTSKLPGYHPDGDGLYLQITSTGGRSWIFRYRRNGRLRDMGLGPVRDVSLRDAREAAQRCRGLLREGRDPIEERHKERARRLAESGHVVTFKKAAEKYIAAHRPSWKNAKHAAQWDSTLEQYVFPKLANIAVSDIEPNHVLGVLEVIWREKPETAKRVRQRIEAILDYAKALQWRKGENAARWRGGLENLLPAPSSIHRVNHYKALDYREMGAFMEALREKEGVAAKCLEFTILTAVRTGESIAATWSEIDLERAIWTIPAARRKGKKHREVEHVVPLSKRALELLRENQVIASSDYVFPGGKANGHLSNMGMLTLLRRMGVDVTVHGFRSSFSDWVAEETQFPREVREAALSHAISSAVEAAYRRGSLFEKRVLLMNAWAAYCAEPATIGVVLPFAAKHN